jgi:hypothetical protein
VPVAGVFPTALKLNPEQCLKNLTQMIDIDVLLLCI